MMMNLKDEMVYLSGPVEGLPYDEAAAAFASAARVIEDAGTLAVWVPTEEVPRDTPHDQAMAVCLNELTEWYAMPNGPDGRVVPAYDLLVSLPGWQASTGARLERAVADALGIRCVELADVMGGDRS